MDERPLIEILVEQAQNCINLRQLILQLEPDEVVIATGYILKLLESRPNKSIIQQRVRELGPEAWG